MAPAPRQTARQLEKKDRERERKLQDAIKLLRDGKVKSVREAARITGATLSTLQQRLKGSVPRTQARQGQQLLTPAEEAVLANYCRRLDSWGYPLQVPYLREYAKAFIPSDAPHDLGDHWVTRFLNRHPDLRSKFVGRLDKQRKAGEDPELMKEYFANLGKAVKAHRLQPEDIYNFDEKGFMLGMGHKVRCITTRGRNAGRLMQDGNRETVTIIETICADGTVLRPLIIWKGKVHTNKMYAELEKRNKVAFTTSKKGYTDNQITLEYLMKVFEPETAKKALATGRPRMIVMDGHASHLTLDFIIYALTHNIILLCLPPHSTHVLQPLDRVLFSPLAHHYSQLIDQYTRQHKGGRVGKRIFLRYLLKAREQVYTPELVRKAFEATGIVPLNPRKVIGGASRTITRNSSPQTDTTSSLVPATPRNSRAASRLTRFGVQMVNQKSPSKSILRKTLAKYEKALQEALAENILKDKIISDLRSHEEVGAGRATNDGRHIAKGGLWMAEDLVDMIEARDKKEAENTKNAKKKESKGKGKEAAGSKPKPAVKRTKKQVQIQEMETVHFYEDAEADGGDTWEDEEEFRDFLGYMQDSDDGSLYSEDGRASPTPARRRTPTQDGSSASPGVAGSTGRSLRSRK